MPDPTAAPSPPAGATPPAPARPPIVRLPTWVNVVIVLTMLASCSAASTAGEAVDQFVSGSSDAAATEADVRDLCRLLGTVAADQDIDLDATFANADPDSLCATAAREATVP
ncbi:hypothetical protein GCM10023168_34820 [Fodinibacter luteus]|uniref:DUF732 domain-containing protein n=1 Tax=Fodinibacter luteus TaxID=552064 RepID=A0ABP8KPM5_9MICO